MPKHSTKIVHRAPPDAEQALQDLEQFGRDMQYLAANYARLLVGYPDWWIAIYRGRVVAITKTPEELVAAMDAAGAPRAHTLIEHLSTNPIVPTHFAI